MAKVGQFGGLSKRWLSGGGSLQQSPFRKTQNTCPRHDKMIQHPYIHERQGLLQGLSQCLVCVAWFRDARGMVMPKNHRPRIVLCRRAAFTTSRGYTDVYVNVPRNSSSHAIALF